MEGSSKQKMALKVASSLLKPSFRYAPIYVFQYVPWLSLVLSEDFCKWDF